MQVLDLSGKDANAFTATPFTIGKYNEKRGIYTTELFTTPGGNRCVHVGIDLGGPVLKSSVLCFVALRSMFSLKVGHPVYLPYDGTIAFQGYNAAEGDYGNCVITKHIIQDQTLYMLFGHLDGKSIGHDAGESRRRSVCACEHLLGPIRQAFACWLYDWSFGRSS